MSDGAGNIAFQLSPPGGKIDHMLTAPGVIRSTVQQYVEEHERLGNKHTPTLNYATSSHNNVLSSSFRPSVQIAFEYTSTSGQGQLGSTITFTPKHNSDYHADAYFKFTMPEVSCTLADLPDIVVRSVHRLPSALALGTVPNPLNFATGQVVASIDVTSKSVVKNGFTYSIDAVTGLPVAADPISWKGKTWLLRTAAEAQTNGVGSISYVYTDAFGNFVAGPDGKAVAPTANGFGGGLAADPRVQVANNVVAADYLGLKLCRTVTYTVDENKIDEYTSNVAMLRRDSFIHEGAKRSFDRLIGHEVPYSSPVEVHAIGGNTANGFGSGRAAADSFREYRQFAHGLQTPKAIQPSKDIYVPLSFYHNLCRANAIPVCIHPDAELEYKIETPRLNELYYPVAGAVFIEERVTLYSPAGAGTLTSPRHELMRRIPFLVPGSVVQTSSREGSISPWLYINNLYLDDVLHVCILSRSFFRMIRLFVDQTLNISLDADGEQEKELTGKFPVEYVMLTEQAISANDGLSADNAQDWHENGFVYRDDQSKYLHRTERIRTGAANEYVSFHDQLSNESVKTVSPIISSMGVSVYDTTFQKVVDGAFYSDYIQYNLNNGIWHAGDRQQSRKLINFSHRPGDAPVIGHCSVSKQRSIKLQMNINLPRNEPPRDGIQGGDVVVATAGYTKARIIATVCQINFVLGSDGTISRRFQ